MPSMSLVISSACIILTVLRNGSFSGWDQASQTVPRLLVRWCSSIASQGRLHGIVFLSVLSSSMNSRFVLHQFLIGMIGSKLRLDGKYKTTLNSAQFFIGCVAKAKAEAEASRIRAEVLEHFITRFTRWWFQTVFYFCTPRLGERFPDILTIFFSPTIFLSWRKFRIYNNPMFFRVMLGQKSFGPKVHWRWRSTVRNVKIDGKTRFLWYLQEVAVFSPKTLKRCQHFSRKCITS